MSREAEARRAVSAYVAVSAGCVALSYATGTALSAQCCALASLALLLRLLSARRWIQFAAFPPWALASFSRMGVEIRRRGDSVVWTWPWGPGKADRAARGPWVSLGFSGNGEWGDARYHTLRDLDAHWRQYEEHERAAAERGG